jgi:glycosyltransferase involved in cell wall biosynthesis
MRIGFVSDGVYPFNKGGKERRLWEISRRLQQRGFDVHIYTMKWWQGGRTLNLDGVQLHAICRGRAMYKAERRDIGQALVFGLATLKLIFARFDVLDVDHMPYFPLFGARLVCMLRRRRMVATWHEVWGRAYWRQYLGRLASVSALIESLAAHASPEIIAVSQQTAKRLATVLDVRVPTHTIGLGVDMAGIDAESPSHLTSDVLFAGRLLSHKRVDLLLHAVSLLRGSGRPDIQCRVVGEGPERGRLEHLCAELGLLGNVTFHDFVPGPAIYGVMKSAKVFALPSVREGFGAVVFEANRCGLPVVTVEHPDNAARHLIAEGRNGFVAEPDAASLARALEQALRSGPTMDPRTSAAETGYLQDWDDVTSALLPVFAGERPAGRDRDRTPAAMPADVLEGA